MRASREESNAKAKKQRKTMSSARTSSNGRSHTLHQLGKSVSCDCIKASSCIELCDIRKLDSLLNQCESISCDNLLLFDEIYNYDLCAASKRKYVSTSALHKILPKNSIRRRTHKKVLGIRENDTKIIKLIDDKRHRDDMDVELTSSKLSDLEKEAIVEAIVDDLLRTQSCTNLMHHQSPTMTVSCCDKTIQTSYGDLFARPDTCRHLSSGGVGQLPDGRKKAKRKQCLCRNYENANFICETSLTTPSIVEPPRPMKSLLQLKRDKSDDKSSSGRSGRFTKQKNTIVDDDECELVNENRVININEKSVEIFPISNNSSFSQSVTPRGTSTNLQVGEDKSETQSQKSKRSKFSPSFISRKLTSRLNSEDDGAGGVKESLLGRSKSSEKKLPEPVETVCIHHCVSNDLDDVIRSQFDLPEPLRGSLRS